MEETSSTANKKRLIAELTRGRNFTKQLQNLLLRRVVDDGSVSTEDLVMKILGSFSNSVSALTSWGSDGRTCDRKPTPAVKNRRGCYKRRKKEEDSVVKIVDTIEDEYVWRKYGQKDILDSKFPRCYFRCKHKHEGCKALKQAQKLEDGSDMFHVTYFGFHTCHKRRKNTQMFSDSGALSFFLHNYEGSKINNLPTSLSTTTNANIILSFKQEDESTSQIDDYLASSYPGKSSISSLKGINDNLEQPHDDIFKDV